MQSLKTTVMTIAGFAALKALIGHKTDSADYCWNGSQKQLGAKGDKGEPANGRISAWLCSKQRASTKSQIRIGLIRGEV